MRLIWVSVALFLAGLLHINLLHAQTNALNIIDPSFEMPTQSPCLPGTCAPPCTPGFCTYVFPFGPGNSTGWTTGYNGQAGIYAPSRAQYPGGAISSQYPGGAFSMPANLNNTPNFNQILPNGNQVAFVCCPGDNRGADIQQTLKATVQTNVTYTLTAWVGAPVTLFLNEPSSNSTSYYDVQFGPVPASVVGRTGAGACPPKTCNGPNVAFGTFQEVQTQFLGTLSTQGDPITIYLGAGGLGNGEVDFDALNLAADPAVDPMNEYVTLPGPSDAYTMVLKGNLLNQIDLSTTSVDPLVNPFAYVNQVLVGSGSSTVTDMLDSNGNTEVTFTGTNPITSADVFCYEALVGVAQTPGCNQNPHFGLAGTSGLPILDQYWTSDPSNALPSLTVGGPLLTGINGAWITLFADVTTGGNTVGQWFEVPYTTDSGPATLLLTNNTGASETLSNVGYFLSPTMIPLDSLNWPSEPPPGQPGSNFIDVARLDGLVLPSGASYTETLTPEPGMIPILVIALAAVLGRNRLRTLTKRQTRNAA